MRFLKVIYKAWMKFAHILGWLNTRIILTLVYLLIFTPLALIFRLIGKDPMDRRFESVDSYWIKREAKVLIGKDPMDRRFESVDSYWIKREAKVFAQEDYRRQF